MPEAGSAGVTSPATGPRGWSSRSVSWGPTACPSPRSQPPPVIPFGRPNRRAESQRRDRSRSPMTYVIAEPCVDVLDLACVSVCPVDCIHYEEGVDRKLFIDPNECIDCGACEPACPVTAIFAEDDVPEGTKEYTAIAALWFEDKDASHAKVAEVA